MEFALAATACRTATLAGKACFSALTLSATASISMKAARGCIFGIE